MWGNVTNMPPAKMRGREEKEKEASFMYKKASFILQLIQGLLLIIAAFVISYILADGLRVLFGILALTGILFIVFAFWAGRTSGRTSST